MSDRSKVGTLRCSLILLLANILIAYCFPRKAERFCSTTVEILCFSRDKMEELKELTTLGEKLGYKGENLQKFVETERKRLESKAIAEAESADRLAKRELDREEAIRKENEASRQHNERMLQLKKELAETEAENRGETQPNVPNSYTPKLPPFVETKDNLDSYLERYERFAAGQKWETAVWATRLSALLKGKALEVYSRLPAADALNYDKLKAALLRRFRMTEEGYKIKLRTSRPEKSETPGQFVARLGSYFDNWIKMADIGKTYEDLRDLLLREQFLVSCCKELAVFLRERKCTNLEVFLDHAERFNDAHGYFASSSGQNIYSKPGQHPGKTSSNEKSQQKHDDSKSKSSQGKPQFNKDERCHICKRFGHIARNCFFRKDSDSKSKALGQSLKAVPSHSRFGADEFAKTVANSVTEAVTSVLKSHAIGNDKGEDTAATCIDKPLKDCCQSEGKVKLECGHELDILSLSCGENQVNGNSCKTMPVCEGKLNGKIVSVLRDSGCTTAVVRKTLVGEDQFSAEKQTCVLIDGTVREFPVARIRIDSPYFCGETDALCMVNPVYDVIIGNIQGARSSFDQDKNWDSQESLPFTDTDECHAVETRGQKAKKEKPTVPLTVTSPLAEVSPSDFLKSQKDDPSLEHFWEKTKQPQEGKYAFVLKNNYLMRLKSDRNGHSVTQVVLPTKYRLSVMRLGHEGLMAGHLGIQRTLSKISSQFFWPKMQEDVTAFCKSCDICQRTIPKGKVQKVPLGRVPIIDEPFQRVALDLVGPIYPVSDKGNRYILTLIDYATRYPEAVALPDIKTETVAEALVEIYSRIGIPSEILTDMGSQFTSTVMREVSRLLSIKQLMTTPFHPICNGLIEHFHSTLKLMLKRLCSERPKDWDRYLAATLFAYREAPHESTKFSPFELMYGRTVRGPMEVLKELFTKTGTDEEVKSTYQYVIDLKNRIRDTCELAHQHLSKASDRYKKYYDLRSRPRSLEVGDQVLVLLPTDNNKLLLQWKGPYPVVARFNDNDYQIEEQVSVESHNEDIDWISMPPVVQKQTNKDVKVNPELTELQKDEIGRILSDYSDIFTDVPKQTNAINCDLQLTTNVPIRSKPYPVPQAVRDIMRREISDMLSLGIIKPSNSKYASPVVMVRKKDNTAFLCRF